MPKRFLTQVQNQFNWGKGVFNRWCWTSWTSIGKKLNLTQNLILHKKINSKQLTDLSVKSKTIKLLEKLRESLQDSGLSKGFLDSAP